MYVLTLFTFFIFLFFSGSSVNSVFIIAVLASCPLIVELLDSNSFLAFFASRFFFIFSAAFDGFAIKKFHRINNDNFLCVRVYLHSAFGLDGGSISSCNLNVMVCPLALGGL